MDMLEALRLQVEWGADEALRDTPQNRLRERPGTENASAGPAENAAIVAPQNPVAAQPVAPARRPMAAVSGTTPPGPAEAARLAAACDSLEALRQCMDKFTGCALKDTATQLVFADGVEDARVMFIGEAPGGDEDRIGRPFVGAAGQLLDKMIGSIGLDRTKVRIANIVPWRPPGNRNPTESEIALCLPFLHRQVALIRPSCLFLLGAVAAKAILPEPERNQGIRRLRGSWRAVAVPGLQTPLPCLPSYHPAYLLRTPAAKKESWHDLLTLRYWLENH